MNLKASFAWGAVENNGAGVGGGDLLGDGQAEADAFAIAGDEGLEEALDDFGGRAGAVVDDAEDDLGRVVNHRGHRGRGEIEFEGRGTLAPDFCHREKFGFDADPAVGASGVGGVEDEVHQKLAELVGVGVEVGVIRSERFAVLRNGWRNVVPPPHPGPLPGGEGASKVVFDDGEVDVTVAEGRVDEVDDFVNDVGQVAGDAVQGGDEAGVAVGGSEELLEVLFGESELSAGDFEAFLVGVAFAGVDLDGHQGAGDVVAEVMREAAAELAEQGQAFAATDGGFHFGEAAGHVVDVGGELADFVVADGERHGGIVGLGDAVDLRAEFEDGACEPTGEHERD